MIPARQHWDDAGAHFATCVLAALFNRPAVGARLIDLSTHEVMALRDDMYEKFTQMGSIPNERGRPIGFPPTGIWPCADGPLDVAAHQRHHWGAFLKMLDNPGELSEESLEDPVLRRDIHDGLAEVISNITAPLSRQELVPKGQAAGLPCCMVYTPLEFSRDPQSMARELFVVRTRRGWAHLDGRPPGEIQRSARSPSTQRAVARRAQPRGLRRRTRLHRRRPRRVDRGRPCVSRSTVRG